MHGSKVSLFIVGAVKAGTTSLFKNLERHPEFYCCPIKEPHFFSNDIQIDSFRPDFARRTNLDINQYLKRRHLTKLHQAYIRSPSDYSQLFRESQSGQILTEASASYLWSKVAAKNIFDYNPQAKIIIVLRNPVERAYSHYLMDLRMGNIQLPFLEALKIDRNSVETLWGNSNLYISLGQYSKQVKRFIDVFPPSQLLIIKYEQLQNTPNIVADQIMRFVGISNSKFYLDLTERHNESKPPFNSLFQKLITLKVFNSIKKHEKLHKLLTPITPIFRTSKLNKVISNEELSFVSNYFQEDILELGEILNINLNTWITK